MRPWASCSLIEGGQGLNQGRLLLLHVEVEADIGEGLHHFSQGGNCDPLSPEGKGLASVGGEVVAGIEALQVCQGESMDRAGAVGHAVHRLVVDGDHDPVPGGAEVRFQVVASHLDGPLEGHHRVLWPELAAASMGKAQGVGSLQKRALWSCLRFGHTDPVTAR